jgi:hypothetical protein
VSSSDDVTVHSDWLFSAMHGFDWSTLSPLSISWSSSPIVSLLDPYIFTEMK